MPAREAAIDRDADSRPRLLILSSTYPRWAGDSEPGFVHELARRLAGTFAVTVLCPHAPNAKRSERMDGVEVLRFRYAPASLETLVAGGGLLGNLRRRPLKALLLPFFLAAQLWATWRCIRRIEPDCVHAHWIVPQGAILALLAFLGLRTPWLLTSHGGDLYSLRGAAWDALKRSVLSRADAVTVVSVAMLAELERLGVDAGPVSVAPMGVDLGGTFVPGAGQARSPGEILFVGRLVEKKGLRYLVEALALLRDREPACSLTVAGAGPEREALERQVRDLGLSERVRFLGPVAQADLPSLYRRAAVFVSPFVTAASGDREGLGLVVIEALGCGCPVIASDIPPLHDVPSDALTLVPQANAALLAGAIAACLDRSGESVADDGARLRAKYDWSAASGTYVRLLRALADS